MPPLFTHSEITVLFRVQLWVSILLGVVFISFPFYTLYTHGLSVLPVYDSEGHEIGRANYFLLSLAVGTFGIAVSGASVFGAIAALRSLARRQQLNSSGET